MLLVFILQVILNMSGDKHATFAFYCAKASVSKEVDNKKKNIFCFLLYWYILFIQILDLATGNHDLYMKRRQEESIEIQQMRYFEEQQKKVRARVMLIQDQESELTSQVFHLPKSAPKATVRIPSVISC